MGVFEMPSYAKGTIGSMWSFTAGPLKEATNIIGGEEDSAAAAISFRICWQLNYISLGQRASRIFRIKIVCRIYISINNKYFYNLVGV